MRIVTKQYRQEDNAYPNLDNLPETDDEHDSENEEEIEAGSEADDTEEEEEGEEDDRLFKIYHPQISASNALNALIRVLIVKLPPQQLHSFWYVSSPSQYADVF